MGSWVTRHGASSSVVPIARRRSRECGWSSQSVWREHSDRRLFNTEKERYVDGEEQTQRGKKGDRGDMGTTEKKQQRTRMNEEERARERDERRRRDTEEIRAIKKE